MPFGTLLIFQSHENDFSFGAERFSNLLQTKDNKPRKNGENSPQNAPKIPHFTLFFPESDIQMRAVLPVFSLSGTQKADKRPLFSNLYPI